MDTFLEIATEIADSLKECNELLKFTHSDNEISFNVLNDNNDMCGYRYSYLDSGNSATKPLADLADNLVQLDVTAINIENGEYIFHSLSHLDIPLLHAIAIDYIISCPNVEIKEYAEKIADIPVCLTSISDTAIANLSTLCPNTKFVKVDFSEFNVQYTDSASLYSYALKLHDSGIDGFSKVSTSLHSSYKNAIANRAVVGVVNGANVVEKAEVTVEQVEPSLEKEALTEGKQNSEVSVIALGKLIAHQKYQQRVSEDQSAIDDLATAYRNAEAIPPIDVVSVGGKNFIVDGFHRFFGAQKAGITSLKCRVEAATEEQALIESLGANAKNLSLRRNNDDKRKAVTTALTCGDFDSKSNREIADICKVSPGLVDKVVKELKAQKTVSSTPAYIGTNAKTKEISNKHTDSDASAYIGSDATDIVQHSAKASKFISEKISNEHVSLSLTIKEPSNEIALNNLIADLNDVIDSYKSQIEEVN